MPYSQRAHVDKQPRVPVGTVLTFPNDGTSVSDYFSASAVETEKAQPCISTVTTTRRRSPAKSCLRSTTPRRSRVFAWRSGQHLHHSRASGHHWRFEHRGRRGYTYSATGIDLSAATSYSAAAAILQTDLNTTLPSGATVRGPLRRAPLALRARSQATSSM